MRRYWVSWWSSYHINKGCTKPPFQVWISGERGKSAEDDMLEDVSLCAVIDAESEQQIWDAVKKHFPDYEERFCNAVEADFTPNNRFPGFEGKTSLVD